MPVLQGPREGPTEDGGAASRPIGPPDADLSTDELEPHAAEHAQVAFLRTTYIPCVHAHVVEFKLQFSPVDRHKVKAVWICSKFRPMSIEMAMAM